MRRGGTHPYRAAAGRCGCNRHFSAYARGWLSLIKRGFCPFNTIGIETLVDKAERQEYKLIMLKAINRTVRYNT